MRPDKCERGVQPDPMRPLRKNKLPKPWLQFKLIQSFLATAVICITVQYGVVQFALSALAMEDPAAAEVRDKVAAVTLKSLYITLAVTIPLILALGTFLTFHVVGPIYSLEKYLKSIISGRDPGTWHLRKGDELQGLYGLLNQAMDTIRAGPPRDACGDPETAPPPKEEAEREVHTNAT